MRWALLLVGLGLFVSRLQAEDWTTSGGRIYRDVQVVSHNAAFVTILDRDGGARIPLSTLGTDLQRRFGYDAAKAPAIVAATDASDRRDKLALADEKKRIAAEDARRMQEVADGIAKAMFAPMPGGDVADSMAAAPNSPPTSEQWNDAPPIASEPPTEIDDFDYYGGYGGYGSYGYGGYGYGGYGYGGYGGYGRSGRHSGYGGGGAGSPGRGAVNRQGAAANPGSPFGPSSGFSHR